MYGKKIIPDNISSTAFFIGLISLSLSLLPFCVYEWLCLRVCLCTLYGLMIASIRRHFPTKIPFHFVLYGCMRDKQKLCSLCCGRLFLLVYECMLLYTHISMCVCMYSLMPSLCSHPAMVVLLAEYEVFACLNCTSHEIELIELMCLACFLPDNIYTQTSLSFKIFHLNEIFF